MIQNYNRYRILMEFFDRPMHKFQLRELSRKVKLGLPSVRNHVLELKKEGFIKGVEAGSFKFYVADRENPRFKLYKRLDIIRRLSESGFVKFLEKELSYPSAIILFGSCAYGEDVEKSDVDIAVIAKRRNLSLKRYEDVLKREIQLHFFKGVRDVKKSPELFNNILNGIVLYGFVKAV